MVVSYECHHVVEVIKRIFVQYWQVVIVEQVKCVRLPSEVKTEESHKAMPFIYAPILIRFWLCFCLPLARCLP